MSESLKELSDRATAGEAYAYMDHYHLIAHPAGSTYVGDQKLVALCACGDKAGANVHFLATLWTLYRRGELHDATALAEAEARGYARGLEEAAKVAETVYEWSPNWNGESVHKAIAGRIRSLATTPVETQKPETGESALGPLEREGRT